MSHDINTIIDMYWDGKIQEVMDAVREDPSLLKCRNEYGVMLLDQAAYNGDKQTVSALLAMGAPPDSDDPEYSTPLMSAIGSRSPQRLEIVELLVRYGADVNTRSNDGDSALHRAVGVGSPEIVQFLLKNGADIDVRGHEDDETPLCNATLYGDEKMVRLLLEHGANPWLRNDVTGTPLETAQRHAQEKDASSYKDVVRVLCDFMDRQAQKAVEQ